MGGGVPTSNWTSLQPINYDSHISDWDKWTVVREGVRLKVMACGGDEVESGGAQWARVGK